MAGEKISRVQSLCNNIPRLIREDPILDSVTKELMVHKWECKSIIERRMLIVLLMDARTHKIMDTRKLFYKIIHNYDRNNDISIIYLDFHKYMRMIVFNSNNGQGYFINLELNSTGYMHKTHVSFVKDYINMTKNTVSITQDVHV